MDPEETVTLYRPVGPKELALIEASGSRAFPPRLPQQPIFYPVLTQEYAAKIARDWNAKDPGTGYRGYVTRFRVRRVFLARYDVQTVGGAAHQEYWIPAEDLPAFNENIVGPIEVVAEFHGLPKPPTDYCSASRSSSSSSKKSTGGTGRVRETTPDRRRSASMLASAVFG